MKLEIDQLVKNYIYENLNGVMKPVHADLPLDVELIEIPPHYRTLKLKYDKTKYSRYRKLPYTQFYFSKCFYYVPAWGNGEYRNLVFISNTNEPISESPFLYSTIFYTNVVLCGAGICWGEMTNNFNDKLQTISNFWLSYFDDVHDTIKEDKLARFRIIQ